MIKRIIIFLATVVLLFLLGYFGHQFYLDEVQKQIRLTPLSMYGFHAIATIIVYLVIEGVFKIIPSETGYLYLALTMVKIGIFILLFQNIIFSEITKYEKVVLVIPFFIFLIVEVVSVGLLLNNADFKEGVENDLL